MTDMYEKPRVVRDRKKTMSKEKQREMRDALGDKLTHHKAVPYKRDHQNYLLDPFYDATE